MSDLHARTLQQGALPAPLRLAVIMRMLLACIIGLHVMNLMAQASAISPNPSDAGIHFARLFTVNAEGKIPTWYSAATLLLCAGLLAVIGLHRSEALNRRSWLALAVVFALMSVDEAASIHEEIGSHLHGVLGTTGMWTNAWMIPALMVLPIFGLYMMRFVLRLPRHTRNLFVLAAGLYIGGALGIELLSSAYLNSNGFNMQTPVYALFATIEELLEMTGVVVFIYALLRHMQMRGITLRTRRVLNAWRAPILPACVVLLLIAGLAGQLATYVLDHGRLLGFVRMFHLDGEGNATSWYSSMLLLSAAIACFMCALGREPGGRCRMWWILTLTFALFSIDEFASLHELSVEPLRHLWQTSGLLHYPWVVGGAVVAGMVFLLCLRDLMHLPRRYACLILASGLLYVCGALGVEVIGAWWSSNHGEMNLAYQSIVAGEELLELTGATLFVLTLLTWLDRYPIALRVVDKHVAAAALSMPTQTTKPARAA